MIDEDGEPVTKHTTFRGGLHVCVCVCVCVLGANIPLYSAGLECKQCEVIWVGVGAYSEAGVTTCVYT